MARSARKWTLDSPTVKQWHEAKYLCGLMCVINFVNSWPMEQALTTVEAQIRPYIRGRWRADLFQSPLIALSNSPSLSRAPTAPSLSRHSVSADPPAQSRRELSLCWRWQPNRSREMDMAESDLILLLCLAYVQIQRLGSPVPLPLGRNRLSLSTVFTLSLKPSWPARECSL